MVTDRISSSRKLLSVSVAGGRAFTMVQRGGDELVIALDAATGKELASITLAYFDRIWGSDQMPALPALAKNSSDERNSSATRPLDARPLCSAENQLSRPVLSAARCRKSP